MNKIKLIYIAIFTLINCALFAQGTLYDANGEKMRGAPMMLAKNLPQSVSFATDINNWYYLQSQGINTIRLCWVDPWYRDNGFQHWSAAEVRPYIDQCVQNANETGMNLIINYHNIDEQGTSNLYYNFSPVNQFWGEIAWRYADNPLVYYEIVNEPTFVSDDYYHPNFKSGLVGLYNQVRQSAPNRHIIMFTFNSLNHDIVGITNHYWEVDWANASVGVHSYANAPDDNTNKVQQLMQNYRVICTEWDIRTDYWSYVNPIDGYYVNGQAWENIGLSWVDWRDWDDTSFNLTNQFIQHAKDNGYYWQGNPGGGGILPEGTYRLYCKWGDLRLNGNNVNWSEARVAPHNDSWTSQMWELERVSGNTYRLKNRWTGLYLSGDAANWGTVKSGPLNTSWTSMMWTLEDAGASNYRLRCNWGGQYLNGGNTNWAEVKNGPLNTNWLSQQWYLEPVFSNKTEQDSSPHITLAPNPSSGGTFRLDILNEDLSEKTVSIYNVQGQEVFRQIINTPVINADLIPGVYYVYVEMQQGTYTEKLVVY